MGVGDRRQVNAMHAEAAHDGDDDQRGCVGRRMQCARKFRRERRGRHRQRREHQHMQSSPGQPFRSGTGHRFRDDDVGAERQVRSMRFDCAGR